MLKVPADPDSLGIHSQRCAKWAGKLISESHFAVHPIAHCLNALPPSGSVPKELRSGVRQKINLTIAATHKIGQHIRGKLMDWNLGCIRVLEVGFSGVFYESGILESNLATRSDQAATVIAEAVLIAFDLDKRIGMQLVKLA
jgi:hypothetical protein